MRGIDPSAQLLQAIEEGIPDDEIVAALRDCLKATYVTKAGTKIPDYTARLSAAKLLIETRVGKPVQRVAITHSDLPDTDTDAMNRILASPAAMEGLVALIASRPEGKKLLHQLAQSPRDRSLAEKAKGKLTVIAPETGTTPES